MTSQEKLFEFLYILMQKRKVTAKEMSLHFAVTPRTIYRWCDSLALSGIPVFTTQGKGGGIFLQENYSVDAASLTEEDRLAISSSLSAVTNLAEGKIDSFGRAFEKMKVLADAASDWIKVDLAPWSRAGEERRTLFETIKKSILNSTQVSFDYYTFERGETQRSVQPWLVVFRSQAWYLYGFCNDRHAPRFFKLSRMKNLSATEIPCTEKYSESREKEFAESSFDGETGSFIRIRACIRNHLLPSLLDDVSGVAVIAKGEGSSTVEFDFPDADWAPNFFIRFGNGIRILEPACLREKVVSIARQVIEAADLS